MNERSGIERATPYLVLWLAVGFVVISVLFALPVEGNLAIWLFPWFFIVDFFIWIYPLSGISMKIAGALWIQYILSGFQIPTYMVYLGWTAKKKRLISGLCLLLFVHLMVVLAALFMEHCRQSTWNNDLPITIVY